MRPVRGAALVLLAATAAVGLAGCSGGAASPSSRPEPAGPATTTPGPATTTPGPASPSALPPAGSLASQPPEPPAFGTVLAHASFRAVELPARAGENPPYSVVYPQVEASVAAGKVRLHAKLPTFRCAVRVAGAGDFTGCTDRAVEYADVLGASPATLTSTPDGGLTGQVVVETYTYPAGGDASPGAPATYTGRKVTLALNLHPVLGATTEGRPTVSGTVGVDGVSATVDRGWISELVATP